MSNNDGGKQEVRLRKDVKQNFQYVPYYDLFGKIKYKAAMEGVEVIFTEEAYTSKASFLDHDPLPKYGEEKPQFSGKRIGRKVIGEAFYGIVNRSVAATPVAVNPLRFSA